MKGYVDFLKKCLYSTPDDLERPYHKVTNITIKITSIIIVSVGLFFVYRGFLSFYNFGNYEKALIDILFGIAHIAFVAGIGSVLIIRYIAFNLPDKIYLRLVAPKEEKDLKRRG